MRDTAVTSRESASSRWSPKISERWREAIVRPAADVTIRNIALIEADRNQPRHVWPTQPHLIDRKSEFLILVTHLPRKAPAGEAGDKN